MTRAPGSLSPTWRGSGIRWIFGRGPGSHCQKPVLAMKAGRTMEGAQAAASHTGGLAKEDMATDLIFKKAGIVDFRDEGQLINAADGLRVTAGP
jgi:hypothetical protein